MIASAMPPSVTSSLRIFIAMGVTDVIGSTPVDIDLRQLLDEGQHGIELARKMPDLVFGDRHARKMRDAANGFGVNGHGTPLRPFCDLLPRLYQSAFSQPAEDARPFRSQPPSFVRPALCADV